MNNNNNNENKPQGIGDYVDHLRDDSSYSQPQGNVYFNQNNGPGNQPLFVAEGAPIKPRSHNGKFLFILLLVALGVAAYFLSPSDTGNTTNNDGNSSIVQEEMDAHDYEIAKIVFKAHFGSDFQEMRIKSASYDTETGVFQTEYVFKVREENTSDVLIISTYDFVNYQANEMIYNEESGQRDTTSYDYYGLPNSKINDIRDLAVVKEYKVANNLTDKEYQELYKIFSDGDVENLTDVITSEAYELKSYRYEKREQKLIYNFEHPTSKDSSITMECYMADEKYCEYTAVSPEPAVIMPEGSSISIKFDEKTGFFTLNYTYTLRPSLITKAQEYTNKLFSI